MSRLRSLLRLDRQRWIALLEAAVLMGAARVALLVLPFRRLARRLGSHQSETAHADRPEHLGGLRDVSWSIRALSGRLPWENTCFVQAIAAQWMLRRRRLPGTLYLGVARDRTTGELLAHAWLRSGKRVLTGGGVLDRGYTVVASFAAKQ